MTPSLSTKSSGRAKFWAAARAGLPMFLGGALMILSTKFFPEIFPNFDESAPIFASGDSLNKSGDAR